MTTDLEANGIEIAGVALERLWELGPSIRGSGNYVPQANDLQKIFDAIRRTRTDIVTPDMLVDAFHFDRRQASYYIEAILELGLVAKFGKDSYSFTEAANRIREVPEALALTLFSTKVVGIPAILRVLSELRQKPSHSLSGNAVLKIINQMGGGRYSGSTVTRRIESVIAWVRWLENNSEFMSVTPETAQSG
jgi:hypothetical protein